MTGIAEILLVAVVGVLTVLTVLVGVQIYKILQRIKRILKIFETDLAEDSRFFWQKMSPSESEPVKEKQNIAKNVAVGLNEENSSSRAFFKNGKRLN